MTYVTPVSNEENCNDIRYTLGSSMVVKRSNLFALADHIESFFGNIHDSHDVVPFVLFANEEFVFGGECNFAALANKPNERDVAL